MTAARDGRGGRASDDDHASRRRAVADAYDAGAERYDERHGDRVSLARARVLDAPLLDAARGAYRVLEIGVDVAPAMLARARARGLQLARADGERLPFADRTFDAVLAGKGSLRYLDPDRALAEAARVLRPGGALALHLYGARTATLLGRRPSVEPGRWELARAADLVERAEAHGLRAVAVHRYRPVRIRPYLLAIPAWLDRLPVQLWGHCVAVFRLPAVDRAPA